ncbi:hypothetical protein DP939_24870 [Spongiactinospora rosea]|uniref:Uncharacterized protein n=1 Tax=Spongiactinospora rosea TaxID=2248750 RepID=A0A366LW96_9ACTN|nr:hypothetical protein [Spongiactinospora rosea]RBQ17594.1 hypothetical protein DP939_24870 [Spongiactinospora rosea]
MSAHRDEIAGHRLAAGGRPGEVGTFWEAVAPDGRRVSALRFDAALVSAGWARQRLVSVVTSDQRLVAGGLSGLMPVLDLVAAGDEVWLLAGHPAAPTLADLMETSGEAGLDPAGAVAVLTESAATLLAVHAAGLAHGSVRPDTVVIAEDGSTLLSERGLADALRGRSPSPAQDVTAWAALARGLAAAQSPPDAALLDRAAATAAAQGLAAGRDVLLGGHASREGLAGAVLRWRHAQTEGVMDGGPYGTAERDEGEIVTLLRVPTSGGTDTPATHDPAPSTADTHAKGEVRFGPGVPARNAAEEIWQSGQQTVHAAERRRAQRAAAGRRRRTLALSTSVFALVVAAAVLAWLQFTGGPALVVEGVNVKAPKKTQGCDTTVTINATIVTNGSAGEVRYEWRRSDRDEPIEQLESVRSGTSSYPVSLKWTVKGEGSFKGTATLRVISPLPGGERVEDKATFTYRCR